MKASVFKTLFSIVAENSDIQLCIVDTEGNKHTADIAMVTFDGNDIYLFGEEEEGE